MDLRCWGTDAQSRGPISVSFACPYDYQTKLIVSGIIEADGTGLWSYHKEDKIVHVGCWGLAERPPAHSCAPLKMALWVKDGTECAPRAAPPVENIRQVKATGGSSQIKPNSLLVIDGVTFPPGLARQHKLRHKQATHSKGQFVRYSCVRQSGQPLAGIRGRFAAHTGFIDRAWGMLKESRQSRYRAEIVLN